MDRSRPLAALTLTVLLVAACSGSSDDVFVSTTGAAPPTGPTSSVATTTSSVPEADTISIEVEEDGAFLVVGDSGSAVDVPAGSLPAGTTVSADYSTDGPIPSDLPDWVGVVGGTLDITADADPEAPVIVTLPIPAGADTDDLYMVHASGDGSWEFVGGSVEDGTYVAAIRSFSIALLVHKRLEALNAFPEVNLPTLYDGDRVVGGIADYEYAALMNGQIDVPLRRSVRIVGPSEMPVGSDALFSVDGFDAVRPDFVDYRFAVYGDGGMAVTSTSRTAVRVSALESGRYVVTVEATDPATGATAFASRRVFVDDGALTAWAIPDADSYCCNRQPVVTLGASGGVPPLFVSWQFGSGSSGEGDSATAAWETAVTGPFLPGTNDTVTVSVIDSEGETAETTVLLPYEDEGPAGMILGPFSAMAGEPVVFTVLRRNFPEGEIIWNVFPSTDAVPDGDDLAVIWEEPGVARVRAFHEDRIQGLIRLGDLSLRVGGPPDPVIVRVADAPATLEVEQEGTWTIRARGGLIAIEDGFRGYTAVVDFGDRSEPLTVEVPSNSAARLSPRVPVSHTYEEEGEYTVTVTATAGNGDVGSTTSVVTVAVSEPIVLRGEHAYEYELNEVVYRVNETEIRFVIRGTDVEVTRFTNDTSRTYVGFTLGGGTVTPDCSFDVVYTLTDSDLTFDPETQAITGTIQGHYSRTDDVGSNCPFGGRSGDEKDLDTEIFDAVIVDGTIEKGWLFGWFTASVVGNPDP